MMKIANPQGKGTTLLTNHWHPNVQIAQKTVPEVLKAFLTSSLVLSAKFSFKPVVAQSYWLYLWNDELRLSLIEPEKLDAEQVYCIGECKLDNDLTWQISPIKGGQDQQQVTAFLERYFEGFSEHLSSEEMFADLLPFYQTNLPYYARVFAHGLSKSISLSLPHQLLSRLSTLECKALMQESDMTKMLGITS